MVTPGLPGSGGRVPALAAASTRRPERLERRRWGTLGRSLAPPPESSPPPTQPGGPSVRCALARPGLTGPAQLRYRERSAVPPPGWVDVEGWYLDVAVPARVQADLDYLAASRRRGPPCTSWVVTALFVIGLGRHVQAPTIRPTGRRRPRSPRRRMVQSTDLSGQLTKTASSRAARSAGWAGGPAAGNHPWSGQGDRRRARPGGSGV